MSRPLRIQYPDAWYHVMNRGRRGENIFSGKRDYNVFVDLLKELVETYRVNIAAYCLMPNHYHLLLKTPQANLSRSMRHLDGVYTQRFNKAHECDGQLFRGRFKSILVDGDSYLLELLRYIHKNPLEGGLVDKLEEYTFSSHKGYLSKAQKWSWLHKDFIFSLFCRNKAERIKRYRQFVSRETSEEINKIFSRKKLPSLIGGKNFVERMKEMFFTNKSDEEIPEARSLAPDINRIKEEVCKLYQVEESNLLVSRRGYFNEPRDVAIYLSRRLRGETLKDIGKEFDIEKYSTVSSIVAKVRGEMEKDRKLKGRVEVLNRLASKGQPKTPFRPTQTRQ
jgi:putative transposase